MKVNKFKTNAPQAAQTRYLHARFKGVSYMSRLLFISLFTATIGGDLLACNMADDVIDMRYKRSQAIYVGYVVGVNYDGFEDRVANDNGEFFANEHDGPMCSMEQYKVRIIETIKGASKKTISFSFEYCGNIMVRLKRRVLIYEVNGENEWVPLGEELYNRIITNKNQNEMDDSI